MFKDLIVAGIGSRQTPAAVCSRMTELGALIRDQGGWVRSGHAQGADWAFEQGAKERCVVYMPYPKFNDHLHTPGTYYVQMESLNIDKCARIARTFHPAWNRLRGYATQFMIRNTAQVLGKNPGTTKKSDIIVCWTSTGGANGGTGQALRIASAYNVPVVNLHGFTHRSLDEICVYIDKKLQLTELLEEQRELKFPKD